MFKKLKLMKKLFPARNPAKIYVNGDFDDKLEKTVLDQIKSSVATNDPDGFMLLINSQGGDVRVLNSILNNLNMFDLPYMGVVENEAYSCGAQLLLACQYRVAVPGASIMFHHAKYSLNGGQILDTEELVHLIASYAEQEMSILRLFTKATGLGLRTARAIYRAERPMTAHYALKLGVVHELSEKSLALDSENEHTLVFAPETSAK